MYLFTSIFVKVQKLNQIEIVWLLVGAALQDTYISQVSADYMAWLLMAGLLLVLLVSLSTAD